MKQFLIMILLIGSLALLVLLLPTPSVSDPASGKALVIQNVRVFDGHEVIEQTNVVVRNGRISAVGADIALPDEAELIDGANHTLMPGLIDGHTHSFGSSRGDALRFGVTTVLDMFGSPAELPAAREQRDSLDPQSSADLYSAGILATAAGGHGTQYGVPVPTLAGPEDAAGWVADRVAEGSDYIKIVIESGRSFGRPLPTLNEETVRAIVEAAKGHGLLSVAHATSLDESLMALRAGVDGLVHIFHDQAVTGEWLDMAVDQGTFVVPTAIVMFASTGAANSKLLLEDPNFATMLSHEQRQTLAQDGWAPHLRERITTMAIDNLEAMHQAGIPLIAGSDAPNPGTAHGISVHQELELLVQAGLSPLAALRAATSVPARHFELSDRGCLQPGCRADMVLVTGDPTSHITDSRAISRVWKNGHEIPVVQETRAAERLPRANTDLLSASERQYWTSAADDFMGGRSSASLSADADNPAVVVSGSLRQGAFFSYAGLMWMPGDVPMEAADLSERNQLTLRLQGDAGPWQLMVFSGESEASRPAILNLVTEDGGAVLEVDLAEHAGIDLGHVRAIGVFAVGAPREFSFSIVEARLL